MTSSSSSSSPLMMHHVGGGSSGNNNNNERTTVQTPLGEAVVLVERVDANYCPSRGEMMEYAQQVLGMDVGEDEDLMWIAEKGLKEPLPENWKPCKVGEADDIFFFNFATGESSWAHPADQKYTALYVEEKRKKTMMHANNRPHLDDTFLDAPPPTTVTNNVSPVSVNLSTRHAFTATTGATTTTSSSTAPPSVPLTTETITNHHHKSQIDELKNALTKCKLECEQAWARATSAESATTELEVRLRVAEEETARLQSLVQLTRSDGERRRVALKNELDETTARLIASEDARDNAERRVRELLLEEGARIRKIERDIRYYSQRIGRQSSSSSLPRTDGNDEVNRRMTGTNTETARRKRNQQPSGIRQTKATTLSNTRHGNGNEEQEEEEEDDVMVSSMNGNNIGGGTGGGSGPKRNNGIIHHSIPPPRLHDGDDDDEP